jgi:hypothetical protein
MRTFLSAVLLAAATMLTAFAAEPVRVVVVDFENQTGQRADAKLGGTIDPAALADKGINVLMERLAKDPAFVLVDRRDYIRQVEKLQPADSGKPTPTKPTYVHAAQSLNADAILRGSLESFSTGKQVVNQGGYRTELATVNVRVNVEALDAVDGTVIAVKSGTARSNFRQTEAGYTEMSEDDAIQLMEQAIQSAVADIRSALVERQEKLAARPKVKLNIKTSADPALVEMDGILVGTTPIEGLMVYQGDHVLTIGKPGYRDITKRILLEKNVEIEVPLMRSELSAEEMKDILEKARLNVISVQGIEPALLIKELD